MAQLPQLKRDDDNYIAILGDESVTVYRRSGKPIEDQVGSMYLPDTTRFGGYERWRLLAEYQAAACP